MIIQNLDFLSPKITLFFKGRYKHSSTFSGLITILSYSVILASIIYYIFDFIDRSNPTVYFYNRFIEDTGVYPLNESSLFHYISLISASKNKTIMYDFNSIRIYGIGRVLDSYIQKYNYSENNHWEYDLCNYDEKIAHKKIKDLIDKKTFSESDCITRYYNSKDKKYYNRGESGFVWPTMEHGSSHPNRSVYGIIVETCQNNSLKNNCNSIEEIELFFKRYAISLNFIDHYADVLNYKEPFTYYFNSITSGLTLSTTISLNNLNFNPNLLKTHNGIFMNNLIIEKSYSFIQSDKVIVNKQGKAAVSDLYFWMQNNMIYNERYYKKFQDLVSNLGGLGSFILLIGFSINSLVSYYVIFLDAQDLVFSIKELNPEKVELIKKPIKLVKEVNFQNENLLNNNTLQISNYPLFTNDKNGNENKKKLELLNLNIINKNRINNGKKNTISYLTNNKIITEYKKVNYIKMQKSNSFDRIKKNNLKNLFFQIKDKNNNIIQKPIKKEKISWFNYIKYIVLFKRQDSNIKFYENFRAQILSEENLMQNKYDIYRLLEYFNIKKNN